MSTTTGAGAPTKTFADFGVDATICESLAEIGITSPFPIQEMTLPLALSGADIIGQARTGTGKTLGFGLPLLQRVKLDGGLQALIIVPTRELCLQVSEDLAQAGKGRGVKVTALYGGKAMQPQIDALEAGAHVVVGTPGRLLDLSRRGHLGLGDVTGLVLDEADEMLDLGFLPDVEQLIEQCGDQRQTLLFSATMPSQIVALARRYMTKPTFMRADVEEINIGPLTKQYFFSCHRMDKPAVLARILQTPDRGLCVVFCRTKRMADTLAEELRERDVPAQAIHSDLRQEARERALQKFREGKTTVLCATEVAARGLDIDDVSHVVNYDCPDDEKMYLHRIGRTGRAGAKGVAITFAVWNELPRLDMIRRELDIEEEVHEVFSTSPLLEELFDLPVREETPKVHTPPEARSGKPSKSRRRSERSDQSEGEGEEESRRGRRSSRDAEPAAKAEPTADARDDAGSRSRSGRSEGTRRSAASDDSGEGPRRRTRRRSRGGDSAGSAGRTATDRDDERAPRARKDDDGDSGRRAARDDRGDDRTKGRSRPAAASDDDAGDTTGDDAGEGRRRTRTRAARSQRSDAVADQASAQARGERVAEASRTTTPDDDGDAESGRRRRSRGGRGRGSSGSNGGNRNSGSKGSDADGGSSTGGGSNRGGGRGKGGDGRAEGRGDDAPSDGGSDGEGSRGRGSRGRNGRGGDDRGGQSRSTRGRSDDGGGNGGGGRGNGGGRGGERRERVRQPAVNSDEARGDGQPRLSRKMEVQHLP